MRRLVAALTTFLLIIGLLVAPASTARAETRDIDNSSLDAVRDAYLTWLRPTLSASKSWDGDPTKCVTGAPAAQPAAAVGTFSAEGQAATLQAINYYRDMAGLKPVTEYAPGSALARQAALIMRANNTLTHFPTAEMACYSSDGATGAGTSNLAIGWVGARAVHLGFIDDTGSGNVPVGHRRWLLYPPLSGVGMGSTSSTTSVVVFGGGSVNANPRPAGGTAWPSAGYVPFEVMPTSGRWSYSAPVGFDAATVAMTKNGSPWSVQVTTRGGVYGDPALVWQSSTITAPAVGAVDTYEVTIDGVTGGRVNYQVKVFRAAVARVGSVTLAGDPTVGATLTATAHAPQPADATVSYAWYADGVKVASGRTYRVAPTDVGKRLVAKATASASGDWASSTTSSDAVIAKPGDLRPTGVRIDGKPVVGETLRFVEGSWSVPTTFERRWLRNGDAIAGAVGAQYRLVDADLGATIKLRVTGTAPGYNSATVTTAGLGPVTAPTRPPSEFATVPTPTIAGPAQVGKTLTAAPGTWSPSPSTLSYRWYRDGKAIAGATGGSYLVAPPARGGVLTVRVTAARDGYVTTTSKPSKATEKVRAGTITAVKPKISGAARVKRVLTAVPGGWKPAATTFSYQWYRNGSKITGATKMKYRLTSADKGKKVSVRVTGRATGYTTKVVTSRATAKVRA